jgi:hypothetical protein
MADKKVSGEVEAAMRSGGESQGGAYPNDAKKGGFSGGQSEKAYHGGGQLGDQETEQGNANAPTKKS